MYRHSLYNCALDNISIIHNLNGVPDTFGCGNAPLQLSLHVLSTHAVHLPRCVLVGRGFALLEVDLLHDTVAHAYGGALMDPLCCVYSQTARYHTHRMYVWPEHSSIDEFACKRPRIAA